jgi:hypothetical protein
MRLKRNNDRLLLTLNLFECRLLLRVFEELRVHYRLSPDEIDPKARAAWYSTRGCATAKMSSEETKEWLDHLQVLKGANLQRLEDWARQLSESKPTQPQLHLNLDDASAFLVVINDHRLLAAARHDIGQTEMDLHSPSQLLELPAAKQEALVEIHFLAWLIEETLRALQE